MLTDIHTADKPSFEIILESQRVGARPIEELMGLAYALGRSRGQLEALVNVKAAFSATDKAIAAL